MPDPTEIRDLAWRTVRDALHTDLHSPCRWSGEQCLALREYGDTARVALDALAEAGMLPTGIEWGAGEVESHITDRVRTVAHSVCDGEADAHDEARFNGESVLQRYTHDWRVTE